MAAARSEAEMAAKGRSSGAAPEPVRGPLRAGTKEGVVVLRDGERFTIAPEGRGARLVAIGSAAHGKVTRGDDGTLHYRPDPRFAGEDSFTYEIIDRRGRVLPATVTLTIEDVEDPPAKSESPSAGPPDAKPGETAIDAPSERKSLVLEISDEILGELEVADDGGLVYTPPKNFIGIDRFGYRVSAPDGSVRAGRVVAWVDDEGNTDFQIQQDEVTSGGS